MTSVNDKEANFQHNADTVRLAAAQGCKLVCFPECFSFIGARAGEAQEAAEELSGPTVARYKALAAEHRMWLSLGGFQEKGPDGTEGDKIYNTHIVVNAEGALAAVYRKIHLFDVPMTGLVESRQALPGSELVACQSPAGCLGLTVCYDVRTGEAHWELLLRCRAIETQCYVLAAAQVGRHNEDGNKRESWGHSLAIDPWGRTLVNMGTTKGLAVVEIDSELVRSTRENMPIDRHRRREHGRHRIDIFAIAVPPI
ncbi:unnamed protein product [Prorocentrum cordatum]|uniref:CN hydrolase domain-containing protein n=1 Tax=Prorocentrum cordatum TaxID=2364126 RepID=A0ABN9V270_9DINO|nr:unnamed protein product [Polarella glacialis]